MIRCLPLAAFLFACATPALAAPDTPTPRKIVEIYHIAPGQQAAFLRLIARCDAVNRAAGLPPRELYVHSDGANWDYMLIQPAETPPGKQAAFDAAWAKSGLPSGAAFSLEIRKYIADHTDTFVSGPTTAAEYLASAAAK